MTHNVGTVDRTIRLFVGLAVILIGILLGSWWGLIGLVPLATAAIGWCPAYRMINFSTKRDPAEA